MKAESLNARKGTGSGRPRGTQTFRQKAKAILSEYEGAEGFHKPRAEWTGDQRDFLALCLEQRIKDAMPIRKRKAKVPARIRKMPTPNGVRALISFAKYRVAWGRTSPEEPSADCVDAVQQNDAIDWLRSWYQPLALRSRKYLLNTYAKK